MIDRTRLATYVTCLMSAFALFSRDAHGQFTEFTDEAAWLSATQDVKTIGFNDLTVGQIVTNQYVNQGVLFTDGTDFVISHFSLMQDGFGLQGATSGVPFNLPTISIEFLMPQYAVAVHYRDGIQIELYSEDKLLFTSAMFASGFNLFGGVYSTVPIDQIRLVGDLPGGLAFIDNLYFAVPAPGGLALLALAALISPRRQRRP